MLAPELCVAKLPASSPEAVIRALAKRLLARGHVKASFEAAAVAREKRSPTGLPFSPLAVALPHAEPEHVESPAIAVASLERPVRFRQMGTPAVTLDVSLVVMPALGSKEQASAGLARILELLQDSALRQALASAPDGDAMCAVLAPRIATLVGG